MKFRCKKCEFDKNSKDTKKNTEMNCPMSVVFMENGSYCDLRCEGINKTLENSCIYLLSCLYILY